MASPPGNRIRKAGKDGEGEERKQKTEWADMRGAPKEGAKVATGDARW
jgi:hypothetical protein